MPARPLSLPHLVQPARIAPAPGRSPALLILLHGYGSDERDLFALAPFLDERLAIVSIRAPQPYPPGFGWYPVHFTPDGVFADETPVAAGRDLLERVIQEALAAYGADPERVALLGFSQGAAMALYTAITRPEKIAAVVAMSGRLVPQAEADAAPRIALTGKPFLVVHGLHDRVLPITEGRAIRDFLARYPVLLSYHEYPMAHEVSGESLAQIAAWLRAWLDDSQ